jgi:hypothetical protein
MKNPKTILTAILILTCLYANSQEKSFTAFRDDLIKTDIKNVLKAVADWQIKTPLIHHYADWTNAGLYAGMVQWAGISVDDLYFEWGINNEYLDKKTYLPAIIKGWKSMVGNVSPDGKVGFIQPVGEDPKAVTKDMTEVYGAGGFLMAGTEITKLIDNGIM